MIVLDNFVLEEYNPDDLEHRMVIEKLNKDENSKSYLGNLFYSIEKNQMRKRDAIQRLNRTFIPYYNDYPIGYFAIYYVEDEYQISYGILKEFRKQYYLPY